MVFGLITIGITIGLYLAYAVLYYQDKKGKKG